MKTALEQLSHNTVIVADSGEINMIKQVRPQDATTNPSLIFKAAQKEEYRQVLQSTVDWARKRTENNVELGENMMDKLSVNFGLEILKHIPGYISTEIDASLSFDVEATVKRAVKIIKLYESEGIPKDRVLIKIAATWEGIKAAESLRKYNINCNLTLVFSLVQAVACAEHGCFLISPFIGRITDWHKKNSGTESYAPDQDPGVVSVKNIYNYFKKYNYQTVVMGASFRKVDQITELAGCDRLTISPELITKLSESTAEVPRKLSPEMAIAMEINRIKVNEPAFRQQLNNDAMATEKLSEGIRIFQTDYKKLLDYILQNYF